MGEVFPWASPLIMDDLRPSELLGMERRLARRAQEEV